MPWPNYATVVWQFLQQFTKRVKHPPAMACWGGPMLPMGPGRPMPLTKRVSPVNAWIVDEFGGSTGASRSTIVHVMQPGVWPGVANGCIE